MPDYYGVEEEYDPYAGTEIFGSDPNMMLPDYGGYGPSSALPPLGGGIGGGLNPAAGAAAGVGGAGGAGGGVAGGGVIPTGIGSERYRLSAGIPTGYGEGLPTWLLEQIDREQIRNTARQEALYNQMMGEYSPEREDELAAMARSRVMEGLGEATSGIQDQFSAAGMGRGGQVAQDIGAAIADRYNKAAQMGSGIRQESAQARAGITGSYMPYVQPRDYTYWAGAQDPSARPIGMPTPDMSSQPPMMNQVQGLPVGSPARRDYLMSRSPGMYNRAGSI